MGNKFGRRKQVVDDKYTRPQGLYQIKDVDYKKLRKLILESKLAPCYPGGDDCDCGILEECPICFLYYPTLNRSRCCTKSICTECFLQMKNPSSTRPTQCPFCKTSNYAVEYRGEKSKEEKGVEQIEEQKVIEAKIRMQQQQLREEEERQHRKEEGSSFRRSSQMENPSCGASGGIEHVDVAPSQDSSGMQMLRQLQNTRQNRDDEFDLDLEDIMVMEAIWLSIQENERAGQSSFSDGFTDQIASGDYHISPVDIPEAGSSSSSSSSSPSGGLACAIATLAERRQLSEELSSTNSGHVSHLDMLPSSSRSSKRVKKNQGNPIDISNDVKHEAVLPPQPYHGRRHSKRVKNIQSKLSLDRAEEWELDHGFMVAEAGTTYASSDDSDVGIEATALPPSPPPPPPLSTSDESHDGRDEYLGLVPPPPPPPYSDDCRFQSAIISTPVIPESFDEQMMLAMAVSIAEARASTTAQGVAWP